MPAGTYDLFLIADAEAGAEIHGELHLDISPDEIDHAGSNNLFAVKDHHYVGPPVSVDSNVAAGTMNELLCCWATGYDIAFVQVSSALSTKALAYARTDYCMRPVGQACMNTASQQTFAALGSNLKQQFSSYRLDGEPHEAWGETEYTLTAGSYSQQVSILSLGP